MENNVNKILSQFDIDKIVEKRLREEVVKVEYPELIQVHSVENRKVKICRKSNYLQDKNFLRKLWITFKRWFK